MNVRPADKCYVFDIETLGQQKNAVVVSAAFLVFDFNANKTFEELLADTHYVKFRIADQKASGRTTDQSTIDWWLKQPVDVKKELAPSSLDMSIQEGSDSILEYLAKHGIHSKNGRNVFRFCRGQDFDIPIMESLFSSVERELPGAFYNSRDIRTFISTMLMTLNESTVYKDSGTYKTLAGFKKHDARHDVAKAVLEMQVVTRLVTGSMSIDQL